MTVGRPTIFLVGAGPGDPDLLTVGAARIIATADFILHDALVPPEILALAKPDAELVCAMHQGYDTPGVQQTIAETLAQQAREHRIVCRLKSGDPMIFANGAETVALLQKLECDVSVMPGISSGLGGPVLAGIPLAIRGLPPSISLISMHDTRNPPDWPAISRTGITIFYMALANLEEISASLIDAGMAADAPAWLMENACRPSQRIVIAAVGTLSAVAQARAVREPAILLVGEVLGMISRRKRPHQDAETGPAES